MTESGRGGEWGRGRFLALCVIVALAGSSPAPAQTALLSNREFPQLLNRCVQLMEASTVVIPELSRAGAPLIENARQAAGTLARAPGGQHAGLTYTFMINVRAYMNLADSVPKPFPFPEEARRQLNELRDNLARLESHFRALLDQRETQLRSPDRDNLRRYGEANSKLASPVAGRPRVLFLGDSITDGWRLNEYFPDRDFVNRGISGQITGEMLGRMKADVIELKPAVVLILAGTNDLARGVPVTAIENNLEMIGDLADFSKIKPMFASILPVSDYHKDTNPNFEQTPRRPPAQINTLNAWLKNFCAKRGYVYVDYFSALVDDKGMLKADLADDGLHPNSAGYRVMAPIALAAIEKVTASPPPQKGRKRQ